MRASKVVYDRVASSIAEIQPGDCNTDGTQNILDVVHLINNCILGGFSDCNCGDLNGDGIVNVLDIVQMVQAILNDTTDDLPESVDVNEDGIINVLDVVSILNYIVTGQW